MFRRTAAFALTSLVLFLAGCAKKESVKTDVATPGATEHELLRPASGGEMVLIAAGRFTMGDQQGRPDETPHTVYVSSFYMDRHLVTQKLYETVMGTNHSKRKAPDNPVERIQWMDAAAFCNKCSELDGLVPCYDPQTWQCDFEAGGYRLPTEAEWEYACRAGSRSKYFFGDNKTELSKYAWCKPHSGGRPHAVGKKRPNRWGLYDMHGNVWQWCNDFYAEDYYQTGPHEDPRGPAEGKQKVLRGGAWNSSAESCRAACRFKEFPAFTDACFGADAYGFRRVRSAETHGRVAGVDTPSKERRVAGAESAKPRNGAIPLPAESKTLSQSRSVMSAVQPAAVPGGKLDPNRLKGTIVFVSDRSENLDIWKMQASGKNLKQLTADAHPDADPRFSPDGKRIMYTSLRAGFPEIWIMNRDGANPARVTEGCQGAWSPDGRSIVFIRDDQAYIRQLDTGHERRVTPESWQRCGVPAWSRDGKQIAVASRHAGSIGIFILGADGREQSPLRTEDPCCTPQWSGDGKRILFQTVKGHIHQLDTENGTEEQLTFGADIQHDGCYSPDGNMIVFCRAPTPEGPWQICIADLQSEDLDFVQITSEGSNSLPDWHPSEER